MGLGQVEKCMMKKAWNFEYLPLTVCIVIGHFNTRNPCFCLCLPRKLLITRSAAAPSSHVPTMSHRVGCWQHRDGCIRLFESPITR
jgi:hypothetical protein